MQTPNINPFKDPRWGRGQETPGEDPFHLQSYVRALLRGLEFDTALAYRKLAATCKHYAGNDMEEVAGTEITRFNFDAKITPQDMSEYYLPPFKTCGNKYLLQTILREHWGWNAEDQWITSDCDAIDIMEWGHHYVETGPEAVALGLKAGTDLICANEEYVESILEVYNQTLITEPEMD